MSHAFNTIESVTKKVIALLEVVNPAAKGNITPSDRLSDEVGLDSLDFIELSMYLERDYKIYLPDDLFYQNWKEKTVADLVEYVIMLTRGENKFMIND